MKKIIIAAVLATTLISLNSHAESVCASVYQGTITELAKVGDVVKKGNPLVKFDQIPIDSQIDSLKADIESTKVLIKITKTEYERATKLKAKAYSEKDYDTTLYNYELAKNSLIMKEAQLRSLEDSKSSCIITAPCDCKVTKVLVVENSGTDIGQKLLEVERLN